MVDYQLGSDGSRFRQVECGALFAVAGDNVPVVAAGAFHAFACFVVAFGLAGVFTDLAVVLNHPDTFRLGAAFWRLALLSYRFRTLFLPR